ncbi:sensor histidine kinase [Streptomyces sp. NPDC005805]|uniref:sensor histidine kinase n=1 Tax=Streptomyces sp. NPDC005805 TaxID=3157068 RepID=UPI0033D41936
MTDATVTAAGPAGDTAADDRPAARKGWRGRSRFAKVDLYTRWTVYALQWGAVLGTLLNLFTRPVRTDGPLLLVVPALLLVPLNGVLCHRFARTAMNAYLVRRPIPPRAAAPAAASTTALIVLVIALASRADLTGLVPLLIGCCLVPVMSAHCLVARVRTVVLHQAAVLAVLAALLPLGGQDAATTIVTVVTVGVVTGWLALTVRLSLWVLGVMWELRDARDVQARLAVAEERLRFGRDLHDVLGRNLAVIALKAELAVQLAERGRPEAVDQMTEVQRIARESQREVREVVRGYREADLRAELEGARSVLAAAGIDCTVGLPPSERSAAELATLSPRVRSALGWVVRESTTNVLRHGDARHCAVTVDTSPDAVELTVENDGAAPAGPSVPTAGSGLAGLRERLQAVGGTLEAGPVPEGRFRVTARVPLGGADPGGPLSGTPLSGGPEPTDDPEPVGRPELSDDPGFSDDPEDLKESV